MYRLCSVEILIFMQIYAFLSEQAETERVIVLDTMQVRSEALTAKVGEVDEQAG